MAWLRSSGEVGGGDGVRIGLDLDGAIAAGGPCKLPIDRAVIAHAQASRNPN